MKVAGLFAGIGGFEMGLATAGHVTTLMSEISAPAREVLSFSLPQVPLVGDVRDLADLPAGTDLIAAGFPCQDLSQAGLGRGLDGERSSLVSHVFRLAERSNPAWILLENVPFMLHLRGGDAMRRIVDKLEEMGYIWAWRTVDTYGFGLPQRRERIFLLASREGDPADVLMSDDNPLTRPTTDLTSLAHGFYWTEGRAGLGWAVDSVPTLKNGSTIGIPSPPAILFSDGRIAKPDIRDTERLQGFPENWTSPAAKVGKEGSRWSLVGNAVSVPVASWIGRRLSQPGRYDNHRDQQFPDTGKLPKAARFDGTRKYSVSISTDPVGNRPERLADFLMHDGQLLSAKATSGFLSRTRVAKLKFPPGFILAVEEHLRHVTLTLKIA